MMKRVQLFLLFACLNTFGALFNHIDDTDEPYGYWEPLHFLLFGHGMQTWEYAPKFAIRSYAFLMPVYLPLHFLKDLVPSKIYLFYLVRLLLGTFSAFAQASFVHSIHEQKEKFPSTLAKLTGIFMVCSSGMLLSSTAFLPSAVSSALLMLALAAWLQRRYLRTIFWGAVAVLWTGWPFVGLVFLPVGLHMLGDIFSSSLAPKTETEAEAADPDSSKDSKDTPVGIKPSGGLLQAVWKVLVFCLQSVLVVVAVLLPALLVDKHYYNKWTVPGLNILLYNALAGRGDELYGVEPLSYYLLNLLLNCNLAWALLLLCPVSILYVLLVKSSYTVHNMSTVLTLYAVACLWLGTLFTRPHKEERFLYPVYGVICFLAAHTLLVLLSLLDLVCLQINPTQTWMKKGTVRRLVLSIVVAAAALLGFYRVLGSYHNYFGYIGLLQKASPLLTSSTSGPTTLCIGAEWHRFPSHFLLPSHVRIQYIRDRFGGILPQHFSNSTFAEPLLRINDLNQEEMDRYVPLQQCDYLLATVEYDLQNTPSGMLGTHACTEGLLRHYKVADHGNLHQGALHKHRCKGDDRFTVMANEDVLSYMSSGEKKGKLTKVLGKLARAYHIPYVSEKFVLKAGYSLLKHEKG